jgi:hypothetical protein
VPPATLHIIKKIERAFLWEVSDKVFAGKCKLRKLGNGLKKLGGSFVPHIEFFTRVCG